MWGSGFGNVMEVNLSQNLQPVRVGGYLVSYGVRVRDSLWCVIICGALVVSIVRGFGKKMFIEIIRIC